MDISAELIDRDYSKLPKKYWKRQNLCWYLHDVIMSIFREVIDNNLIETTFEIDDLEEYNKYECIYDWLEVTGKEKEFILVTSKDLSMRLLGDFLNYIHESLVCLEKGKLTVCCDLLRKPFKDNLFYLEWLLYDDKELVDKLHHKDAITYALDKIPKWKKQKIISYNVKHNNYMKVLYEESNLSMDLYDIRYNYNADNSMQLLWNKATHLVTTFNRIKTNDFNFIYNNKKEFMEIWDYLYGKLPLLLLYSLGVIINIFKKYFNDIDENVELYNFTLIIRKFFLNTSSKKDDNLKNIFDLYLYCPNCNTMTKSNDFNEYLFDYYWDIYCPDCKHKINICKFRFIDPLIIPIKDILK